MTEGYLGNHPGISHVSVSHIQDNGVPLGSVGPKQDIVGIVVIGRVDEHPVWSSAQRKIHRRAGAPGIVGNIVAIVSGGGYLNGRLILVDVREGSIPTIHPSGRFDAGHVKVLCPVILRSSNDDIRAGAGILVSRVELGDIQIVTFKGNRLHRSYRAADETRYIISCIKSTIITKIHKIGATAIGIIIGIENQFNGMMVGVNQRKSAYSYP